MTSTISYKYIKPVTSGNHKRVYIYTQDAITKLVGIDKWISIVETRKEIKRIYERMHEPTIGRILKSAFQTYKHYEWINRKDAVKGLLYRTISDNGVTISTELCVSSGKVPVQEINSFSKYYTMPKTISG